MEDLVIACVSETGTREVRAVRYCLYTHSRFFRELFGSGAPLKRGADDMFRLEVSPPFAPEDFEAAVRVLHGPQPWSLSAGEYLRVFAVFDYLDVDRSGVQVRLAAASPDSEKLAYLRLIADPTFRRSPAWALFAAADRCFERRAGSSLAEYLEFLDAAMAVVRADWRLDDDEDLMDHVETRVRSELLRAKTACGPTEFWDEACSGFGPDRLASLRCAFPPVVCAFHARRRGRSTACVVPAELPFAHELAHRIVNGPRDARAGLSALAVSHASPTGFFGVLVAMLDRDACVKLHVGDSAAATLTVHAGVATFRLRKQLLAKASSVHAHVSTSDALVELTSETVPLPPRPASAAAPASTGAVTVVLALPFAP